MMKPGPTADAHAIGCMLPGRRFRHTQNAMFGRDVRAGDGEADLAQDRSHVDHGAAVVTQHRLDAGALGIEDAVEIHPDHLVPGVVAVRSRRLLLPADTGVGDHDVDPTKIIGHFLHRVGDPLRVGYIDDRRTRGAAVLLQLGDRLLERLSIQVPQRHGST